LKNEGFERFSNLASGINSLVLAIAVLVGGIWTIYIFDAELKVENAEARLQAIQREIDVAANLTISMSGSAIADSKNNGKSFIALEVRVENSGNRSTTLHFDNWPVRAAKISSREGLHFEIGTPVLVPLLMINSEGEQWRPGGKEVSSGSVEFLNFIIPIQEPGIYLLTFEAFGSEIDRAEAIGAGFPDDQEAASWASNVFVSVD